MKHSRYDAPAETSGATALVDEAKQQPLTDGGLVTSRLLSDALRLDPHHHEALQLQERLHQMAVPRWHFPMLADTARNRAYAKAIAAKVRPGDIVLDIGCGAGLTAMLAARAGAKHVYTCEQQPLIAAAAEKVIAQNGLSDRITVIPKWAHEIQIGVEMPEPADVVVSEIVDTVLLGEGALATLTMAMRKLAKPGARTVPETGVLMAQPIESDTLFETWRPGETEGFQLSAFHQFANVAQLTPSDLRFVAPRPLGFRTELFGFDFARPAMRPARLSSALPCTEAGTLHAVLATFEMRLSPGITVSNGIEARGHWGRTAFLMERPEFVTANSVIAFTAQHDTSSLSIKIDSVGARSPQQRPLHDSLSADSYTMHPEETTGGRASA